MVDVKFSSINFDSCQKLCVSLPASWVTYIENECIAHDLLDYTILGYTAQRRKFENLINIP